MRVWWVIFTLIIFWVVCGVWLRWQGGNFEIDLVRINKIVLCIQDKQIPCRWIGNYGRELGAPIFNYVAPLPYYVGGFLYLIFGNYNMVTKIVFLIPSLFLVFSFWNFAKMKIFSKTNFIFILSAIFSLFWLLIFIFGFGVGFLWSFGSFWMIVYYFRKISDSTTVNNCLGVSFFTMIFILSSQGAFLITFGVIAIGIIYYWFKKKTRAIFVITFGWILAVSLASFYVLPMILESDLVKLNAINGDYIPISVKSIPDNEPIEEISILAGDAQIFGFEEHSSSFRFGIDSGERSIVRVAVPYFPNLVIKANGVIVKNYFDNNSMGLSTFIFGQGRFIVEGRVDDTPVREVSNMISFVSLIIFSVLLFSEMSRIRSGLKYYLKALHS